MIERIHLEIIRALVDEGSLTKAADKISLTQPALTHSIKKLESLLGCTLWTKEGRSLKLTNYGNYLYKRAKKILPQFKDMEDGLKGLVSGKSGTLKICVECNPCYELLVGKIGDYLKKWPLVDIDVSRNFSFNGIEALLNRSIDMIITPDKYEHKKIHYYPIKEFSVLIVTSTDHPFNNKDFITPKDFKDETIYTYPVDMQRLDLFTDILIPHGVRPKRHITIEETEIILQLVSANRGISYFPDWLINKYSSSFGLKSHKIGDFDIKRVLYLAIREEDKHIGYLKDFIDQLSI